MKTINIPAGLIRLTVAVMMTTGMPGAQTYYVDKNHSSASDLNPGTPAQPWATIGYAAETLVAGDTVLIRAGVYHESIRIGNHGNATNGFIVFSGYPGEMPIIDGTDVTDTGNGVIIDKSYIRFDHIEIRHWNDNGMWIEKAAHIEISDCEVHDVFCGIGFSEGTHDFELNRIAAHHFTLYGFDASPNGSDCYNGTFNDCVAHTARDPEQNVDGFALGHGTQHDFTLNRCIAYEVYDGFDISARKSILNSCLAHDCWNGAYKLWQDQVSLVNCIGYNCTGSVVELDWDGSPGTTTLTNCTFYNGQTYTVWIENSMDILHMVNCILAGGDNIGLAFEQMGAENYQGDYNLFQNDNPARGIAVGYEDEFSTTQIQSGNWTAYSGQDTHSLVTQSDIGLFVNPCQADLHLLSGCKAVDHGTGTGAPDEDFEGNPRPSGSGYDIGAYEYAGTDIIQTNHGAELPRNPQLHQNCPNPFNPCTTISFELPRNVFVSLKIYNSLGETVTTLVSEELQPGTHQYLWQAGELPGGLHFYRLEADHVMQTGKMLLLK
ncbi:right-handed parallel beta-helix repeat-containing protein [bacterium]|nr:right-handed parallel beta-helix repeat-containing protein [bacterium]RQV97928.1 MAG: hypothetical protein EH221_02940 [bacterium]